MELLVNTEICSYCQRPYNQTNRRKTIDHLIPKSRLGIPHRNSYKYFTEDQIDNLLECCLQCNQMKNNMTPGEWKSWLQGKKFTIKFTIINSIDILLKTEPINDLRLPYLIQ